MLPEHNTLWKLTKTKTSRLGTKCSTSVSGEVRLHLYYVPETLFVLNNSDRNKRLSKTLFCGVQVFVFW